MAGPVLTHLDAVFASTEGDESLAIVVLVVLVVLAVVDAASGRVETADAGHLPLLHVPASGGSRRRPRPGRVRTGRRRSAPPSSAA